MAANKILQEMKGFINFADAGFKYNLQVFPDTLTAGALLFTLLFQSPAFAGLSGSLVLLNFLHPVLATFLSSALNGMFDAEDAERCSGHFPGMSYERLIGASTTKTFGSLHPNFPSYYSTFLGFLTAYIGALPLIYHKELSASPRRQAATTTGLVVLALLVVGCIVFRVMNNCDTIGGIFIGFLAGATLGACIVGFLAYITDRRITNILNFPLIRGKTADGKPIYVCERK